MTSAENVTLSYVATSNDKTTLNDKNIIKHREHYAE